MTLDDAGFVLPRRQRRPLRALGFLAMHDAFSSSKRPGSDQRVSQRIWLFKTRGGAKAWLQKTKDDSRRSCSSPKWLRRCSATSRGPPAA